MRKMLNFVKMCFNRVMSLISLLFFVVALVVLAVAFMLHPDKDLSVRLQRLVDNAGGDK